MAKPTRKLNWYPSGTVTEPSSAKKALGWIAYEEIPYEWLNWLQETASIWEDYIDGVICTDGNTFLGESNGADADGLRNVAVGYEAFASHAAGSNDNTLVGYQAGNALTVNDGCTGVGAYALTLNTSGAITAFGFRALSAHTTGLYNTAVGYSSSLNLASADHNTSVGYYSLRQNTAEGCSAVGSNALTANVDGEFNSALGAYALAANISGDNNVALGYGAVASITGGSRNIGIGASTLAASASTLSDCVAIGHEALKLANSGNKNVAIGTNSGDGIDSGVENVLVGYRTGRTVSSGSNNVLIGFSVDVDATTYSDCIVLGSNISATSNAQIRIGDATNDGNFYLCGNKGVTTFGPSAVTSITVKNGIITAIS